MQLGELYCKESADQCRLLCILIGSACRSSLLIRTLAIPRTCFLPYAYDRLAAPGVCNCRCKAMQLVMHVAPSWQAYVKGINAAPPDAVVAGGTARHNLGGTTLELTGQSVPAVLVLACTQQASGKPQHSMAQDSSGCQAMPLEAGGFQVSP